MFGQSLLSAFGIACTTDTDQLFNPTSTQINSLATYQLNNATTSIPSNTYPGTANNITYAAGKFGNAAVFNGSSGDIDLPANIESSTMAVSLWAYLDDNAPTNQVIIEFENGYGLNFPSFASGKLAAQWANSNANHTLSNVALSNGQWYHIAANFRSGATDLYINGVQQTTGGTASDYLTADQNTIGSRRSGEFFDGMIDQVRIFNSALSQAAVTALYNETTTTAQNAYITEEVYNGIAYYKMSDATDQLGNYNGTATDVNFNTEGKFGFAGAFNGSSGSGMLLPAGINKNNNFSWSFWVKFNSFTLYDTLVGFFTDGYTNYLDIRGISGNNAYLNMYDGNSGLATPANSISTGSWYHVVFTKSSTTGRKIYINGSEVASNSSTSNSGYSSAGRNFLGAYSSSGNPTTALLNLDGKLDQIRIYDSALSAADVTTLYKEVECSAAAINALDHFNTITYDGTGGSQSTNSLSNQAGTLGFAPGMTWIKSRSNATWHEVHDVVRGNLPRIFPNDPYQELTSANGFASFDSNGFSLDAAGSGGDVNTSGRTYVAWNWKAALANLSTNFYTSTSGIEVSQTLLGSGSTKIFSISFWFKTSSNNEQYFVNTGAASTNTGIGIYVNPTNGYLRYQTSNGGGSASSSPYLSLEDRDLQDGKWHHVVATYSSAGGTNDAYTYLYLDGQDVTSLCTAVNSWTQGGAATWSSFTVPKIVFGKWADGNFYNVIGNLAQVRFFSDVVTSGEVSDLYTEPAASNNTLNYPAGAGCIAAYPLQTDAVDLSGNYSGASSNVTFGQPGYLTSNTAGTITSTVAANSEAGFSIVEYAGNGSAGATVGHGLTSPQMVMIKCTSTGSTNWIVYADSLGNSNYLTLNDNTSQATYSNWFYSNATTFTLNQTFGNANTSGRDYVAYCFTSIPGYSHIGSYVGTSSAGNFQYTGFEPSWLMVKCSSASGRDWVIFDDKRISGSSYYELYPNTSGAENGPYPDVTLNSTGFTLGTNASFSNQSGDTYIFLAIA
jgi:hypothetical protein